MTACQEIAAQPDRSVIRSDGNKTVISSSYPAVIDAAQTGISKNLPDHRANLALCVAYLLAATDRDFRPLAMDSRNVDAQTGAARPKLWRLWQIRSAAKTWVPLLRSTQPNDPLVVKAAAEAAELLEEVMKSS